MVLAENLLLIRQGGHFLAEVVEDLQSYQSGFFNLIFESGDLAKWIRINADH